MAHNLTVLEDAISINGVKVASSFAFGARTPVWKSGAVWHGEGIEIDASAYEALRIFDPTGKYDPVMKPLFLQGGTVSNFALVGIEDGGEFKPYKGYPVATGTMERDDWAALNGNLPYQRAQKFELVAPSTVATIFDRITAKSNGGKPISVDTIGLLGKHGSDGFFLSVRLPDWDADVSAELGTNVEEYLFVVVHPTGRMWVGNGSQIVVCQNTAMAAINGAARMLKTGHVDGATARLTEAMENIYETSLEARELIQSAAIALNRAPVTAEIVEKVANNVYRDPRTIDVNWIGKSSLDERSAKFEQRLAQVEAKRAFVTEIFQNDDLHTFAGITPEMKGSAFAAWQAFTVAETYSTVGRKALAAINGVRANAFLNPLNAASRTVTEKAFASLVELTKK